MASARLNSFTFRATPAESRKAWASNSTFLAGRGLDFLLLGLTIVFQPPERMSGILQGSFLSSPTDLLQTISFCLLFPCFPLLLAGSRRQEFFSRSRSKPALSVFSFANQQIL